MSKFLSFLRKSTGLMLVLMVLFANVQLPVFAEENNAQTGAIVITDSGSTILEEQDSNISTIILNEGSGSNLVETTSTGEVVLGKNTQSGALTNSGVLSIAEEVIESARLVDTVKEKKQEAKQVKKDEKQMEHEAKFKRKWSDDEVIKLGYIPGEVSLV